MTTSGKKEKRAPATRRRVKATEVEDLSLSESVALPADSEPFGDGGFSGFVGSRDDHLASIPSDGEESPDLMGDDVELPQNLDNFRARDPFTARYIDYRLRQKSARDAARAAVAVNESLRQSLLERPYLMPKPEEGAMRGASAVWRSLRDQLREESLKRIDESGREELEQLERDLAARKMLVEGVGRGIDMLLQRLRGRMEDASAVPVASSSTPSPAPAPATAPQGAGASSDSAAPSALDAVARARPAQSGG